MSQLTSMGLVVFDLDGTLVDSLRDIAEAVNHCLDLLGMPPRPVDQYRYLVGEGIPALCERAIGRSHPHMVARLAELTRARYRTRLLIHTAPYAGVAELVSALKSQGMRLAVLSNKPHDMTVRIVSHFWPNGVFDRVQGYVREEHRKPSPFHLLEICEAVGIAPARAVIVGDTPTDIHTARAAGAESIGVTWGFRTRADLEQCGAERIVDSPAEARAAIGERLAAVP